VSERTKTAAQLQVEAAMALSKIPGAIIPLTRGLPGEGFRRRRPRLDEEPAQIAELANQLVLKASQRAVHLRRRDVKFDSPGEVVFTATRSVPGVD